MTLIRHGIRVTPARAREGLKVAPVRPAPASEAASLGHLFLLDDRYRLLARVGEGGMGVVWRALDLDLDEIVAVKFLREDLANDPRLVAAFRREIKLGRRVTHRNVARVFEFGHTDELYFLTMEFIAGESLHAHLHRCGPRPALWVLELAAGLCRGLAAALAVGVVHGDIKPGNILMSPGRGAVITDFGIARALSEPLAREEYLGGTPHYMAPEQALHGQLSPASDVYSVGIVLFEALAGRSPWPTRDARALLELQAAGHEPALRSLAPQVRPEWLELLTACLRAEPGDRPRDVRALLLRLAALRGVL